MTAHEFAGAPDEPISLDRMARLTGEDDRTVASADGTAGADGGIETVRTGHGQVARGSLWFMGVWAVTAAAGLTYWSLAAHVATKETVGAGSSLFSALLFTNYATSMGLQVAVARFCTDSTRRSTTLFHLALAYTAITSTVGSLALILAAPAFLDAPSVSDALYRWGTPAAFLLFALLVCGQSFAVLVEVRLVTLRLWRWAFVRVVLVAVLRLPLLAVPFLAHDALGLLVIMAGLPALSGFVGVVILKVVTPGAARASYRPLPADATVALRYASVNYIGVLAAQAPQYVLPLIVQSQVEVENYASFYLAWTVTTVVFLVPQVIGQVVLAEGSRDDDRIAHADRLRHQVRVGLSFTLGVMAAAALGAALVGQRLTELVFGEAYHDAGRLLPLLVGAGLPWAVTAICLAYVRVRQHAPATVAITLGFALCTIVPSVVMVGRAGVEGAVRGWLAGNVVACLIAVVVTAAVTRRDAARLVGSQPLPTGTAGP